MQNAVDVNVIHTDVHFRGMFVKKQLAVGLQVGLRGVLRRVVACGGM